MAEFNPQIPEMREPNYLGYSRPISQPEPNKSTALAIASAGNILETGVTGIDQALKKSIADETYKGVDQLRNQYTSELENLRGTVSKNPRAASNLAETGTAMDDTEFSSQARTTPAAPEGTDIIPAASATRPMPQDLENLPGRIDTLMEARAKGLSQTRYLSALDNLATNIRSRYPGYREYADREFSRASGVDPANAKITSLIRDINSYTSAAQANANKIENLILHNLKIDGMDKNYAAWKNGQLSDQGIISIISKKQAQEADLHMQILQNNADKSNDEKKQRDTGRILDTYVASKAATHWEDATITAGGADPDTGQSSPAQQMAVINAAALGKIPRMDPARAQELSVANEANKRIFETKMYNDAVTNGWVARLGPDEVNKRIKAQSALTFDSISSALRDEKYGLAFVDKHMATAYTDRAQTQFLEGSMADFARKASVIERFPVFGKALWESFVGSEQDQKVKAWLQEAQVNATVGSPDPRTASGVRTLLGDVNKFQQGPGKTPPGVPASPMNNKAIEGLLDFPAERLVDPKTPDEFKIKLAKYAFSPEGRGLIDKFKFDYVDKNGDLIPGKYAAFDKFAKQSIAAEIVRLDTISPGIKRMYNDWLTSEFGSIFKPEIRSIKDIPAGQSRTVNWHSETSQMSIDIPGIPEWNKTPNGAKSDEGKTINTLNHGLRSFRSAAEALGVDVDTEITKQMVGLGYRPQPIVPQKFPTTQEQVDAVKKIPGKLKEMGKANEEAYKQGFTPKPGTMGEAIMNAITTSRSKVMGQSKP